MLPLAHVGHYLWTLYLLPVIFVIAGILKTTLAEKKASRTDELTAPEMLEENSGPESSPPA